MGRDDEDWHVWDPIPELDQEDLVESDPEFSDVQVSLDPKDLCTTNFVSMDLYCPVSWKSGVLSEN
jgi:hypothetical protein